MQIDAHQHFWRYSETEYPWMLPHWPIRRDYLPHDLAPELKTCGIGGSIAVQARQSLEETRWLLELATASPIIKGVVGWVDLQSPSLEEQLAEFAEHPKFVGVRHVVQDEDETFMERPAFRRGLGHLQKFSLAYDLLILAHQLSSAISLVKAFPEQRFVLDHLAKPGVRDGFIEPWAEQIHQLAECPNVHSKLSGLLTEADWESWQPADFQPYLDVAVTAFGPARLMFGSDWPVSLLAGRYSDAYKLVSDYVNRHVPQARDDIFGRNASVFYQLPS